MLLRFYYCSSQQAVSAIFLRKLSYNKTYPFEKCSCKNKLKFLLVIYPPQGTQFFKSLKYKIESLLYCVVHGKGRKGRGTTNKDKFLVGKIIRKVAKILFIYLHTVLLGYLC